MQSFISQKINWETLFYTFVNTSNNIFHHKHVNSTFKIRTILSPKTKVNPHDGVVQTELKNHQGSYKSIRSKKKMTILPFSITSTVICTHINANHVYTRFQQILFICSPSFSSHYKTHTAGTGLAGRQVMYMFWAFIPHSIPGRSASSITPFIRFLFNHQGSGGELNYLCTILVPFVARKANGFERSG